MAPSSIDGESEREVVSEDIQLQIDSQSQRIRDVSPPQDKDIIAAEITSWGVCDSPQPLATQSQELKPTLTMYYGDRETKRKAPEFEQLPPNVTKRRKHLKASSTPLFSQDQHHIQDPSFLAQQYRREFLAARRDSISTPRGETEVTEGKASDIFSSSEGTHQRLLPPRKGSTPFIEDHLDSITNSKNNAPNALSQSNTEPQNLLQSTSISESYLTDDLEATHEMETKALNAMGLSDLDDQALLHSLSEHPAPHIDDVLTTLQSTEKKDLETRSLSDADFQLLLPSTENPAPRPNDDLEPTYRLEETTFAALDAFSDMHQDALPSQDSPCGDRIEIEPVVEENAFNVIESDGDPQLLLPVEKDSEPHLSDNVEPIHPLEEKLSDAMSLSNDQRQSLSPFGEQSVPHHDDNPESTLDLAENATDVTRPYVEWRPESSVFQKDGSYHRDDSTKGRSGVEEVAPGEIIPPVDLDKGTFQEMNGLIGSDRQCNETDSESARSTKQDARATPAADPTDDGAIQNAQLAQTGQPIVNSGLTVMDVEIKETTTDDQVSFLPEMPADHVSLSPPLDIYHRFKNAYPEYSGDVKHFIAISKKIKILVENDHMEHRSLWDDFIIRHKTEYPQYLQYCTEIVEDPIPYERYYHNEVDERKYSSRIITPGNLGEVFALECDVSDSTENRSVPQRLVDLRVDPRAPEQKLRSPSRSVRRISFESQTPPSSSPLPNHSQQELPVYSEPDRGGLDLTSEASTIPIMTHIEKRKPTSASPTPKYLQNGNTIGSNNDGLDHTPMILSKPSSITNESYRLSSKAPVLEYTQHDHNSDLKGCDNQLERTPETLPNSSEANVASHKSPSPKPMIEHSPQHYGMKNKTAFVDQKLSSTLDPELSNNGTRKSSLSSSVSLSQGVIDLTGH
ncbi:hypothetical protein MMC12_001925, partial [Toensbergia leucococca]|nr:hypothetical protein [Toensbergia leucococca]